MLVPPQTLAGTTLVEGQAVSEDGASVLSHEYCPRGRLPTCH